VIHASDGNIPSDMATGSPEQVEEERRLFYVALTRAKRWLYVCYPLRYYHSGGWSSDSYGYAQMTRFVPDRVARYFQRTVTSTEPDVRGESDDLDGGPHISSRGIRRGTKRYWH